MVILKPREAYGEKVQRRQLCFRGDRMRALRTQKGMSQNELAQECEIGRTMITNLENNVTEPSLIVLVLICQALKCSADYLLDISSAVHHTADESLDPLPFD